MCPVIVAIIYLTTRLSCREQYLGSAISFKQRFRTRKSDIKTNKIVFLRKTILIINVAVLKQRCFFESTDY